VTEAGAVEVYYDPFDFEIDDNPYPTWKRLRDEAPLYFNEKYNFYALSRYEDVARELPNWATYRSGRGTTMDIIMSGIEVPPGVILFEDPPLHDLHRRVLSRVFTPRRMEEVEPLTRRYCVRALDPLVGSARFDFIEDLGAKVPMRTIGYLLGIPEEDQQQIRDKTDRALGLKDGTFKTVSADMFETAINCSPSTSTGAPSTRRMT
jgi:cytochrome P450